MNKKRLGIVVPHTHWDRAWYLPFQAYRLRLVEMMSDLLNWLESGALPLFVLDGQTVLLEDYFAVRPQDKSRVQALVKAGRIKVGPWYTMPDCFLARPESLIRNLQRGLQMAEDCGGASRVGYVPDTFGHFAQLPQILSGFAIDSFLFMRGMPEQLRDEHGALFVWQAPGGENAQVLATFLREGYFPLGALGQESFHGRYDGLSANEPLARQRLSDTLARLNPIQKESVLVLPAGGDHLPARNDLADLVTKVNTSQDDIELRFGSFEDYLQALRQTQEHASAPVFRGDLLGQADHPLLRNVLSSRVDLKILNHQAQSLLLGIVEPLLVYSKLNNLPCVDPALMQIAWDALMKNHAHDDICGCSVDDVHLDDVQRFHEVLSLGQEIVTRQLEHVIQSLVAPLANSRAARVVVFNPHPWRVQISRRAQVLLPDVGGEFSQESYPRMLTAENSAGENVQVQMLSSKCKAIRNRYLETTWGRSYDVNIDLSVPALGFEIITLTETQQDYVELHAETSTQLSTVPQSLVDAIRFELDADLGDGYSFGPCPEIATRVGRLISTRPDEQEQNVFHLSFEIEGHLWILRDELARQSMKVCLGPVGVMPLQVKAIRRSGASSSESQNNKISAGSSQSEQIIREAQWELQISYTNIFKDSRLRLVVDPNVIVSSADFTPCQEIIAHGQAQWNSLPAVPEVQELWDGPLAKPAYPGEKPYTVHHTNDGVVWHGRQQSAYFGGVGLHEFEVVASVADLHSKTQNKNIVDSSQNAPAIAFTLHRAVGFLSVRGGRIRSCQAGPQRPTPDAQLQKHIEHVVAFGCAENPVSAVRALKETLHPCWVQECPVVPQQTSSKHPRGLSVSLFDVGATSLEVMCLKPSSADGAIILRIVNPTSQVIAAPLKFAGLPEHFSGAVRIQLDEQFEIFGSAQRVRFEPVNNNGPRCGVLQAHFKPYEIQTWKISPC